MWESDFQNFVRKCLRMGQKANAKFSLRALAKKTQVSPSTLSDLINGHRHVSDKKALDMLSRLQSMDPERASEIEAKIRMASKRVPLEPQNYDLILEWRFLGILCLLEMDDPPRAAKDIANALGLTENVAARCLDRLTETGMIAPRPEGGFRVIGPYFETTDEIPNKSVVRSHVNSLEKAREALERLPLNRRDFTSVIVAGDRRRLSVVKRLARRFIMAASQSIAGTRRDEVYQMSVHIYPLTKQGEKE